MILYNLVLCFTFIKNNELIIIRLNIFTAVNKYNNMYYDMHNKYPRLYLPPGDIKIS